MIIPASLPPEKSRLLEELLDRLSQVPHIQAVVLGGSFASGTQHSQSDLDIGLYYSEAEPFSLEAIRAIAGGVSLPDKPPTVTGFYEWGAWVNGGAWIQTQAGKLDFLYRNLDQVQKTIREAQSGICLHDYDQQPAHGFYSVGYLAETHMCIPLYDPQSLIAGLKKQVQTYPASLKHKIIADSLWSAQFTLIHARGFAGQADIYGTVGCLNRAAANLTQALFALNETYFLSDKNAMQRRNAFKIMPEGYVKAVLHVLACPGETRPELEHTVAKLEAAWQSVADLAEDGYKPRF
jgi:hypothetical protein